MYVCVSSDTKSSSAIRLSSFIHNSITILTGNLKINFIILFYGVLKLFAFYHNLDPIFVLHTSNGNWFGSVGTGIR